MTTELVKKAENGASLDGMLQQADLFVKSGFFPKHIDTKEKAVVVMLKGRELGMPFTEALSKICVINGVATTKVETLLGLARKTGQMEDFKQRFFPNEVNPSYCEVTIKRKGQTPHTCRFGDEEIATMQLGSKDNYKKQKATMISWRAIAKNLRVTFPDAIGGLYLEEEIAEDVILTPTEAPQVTEVIQAPRQEAPAAPSEVKQSGDDLPEDQLGNWIMPMGKYANRRLIEIYADVTDGGKQKGKEYLVWCAENLRDEKSKTIIQRFLALVSKDAEIDMNG